MIRVHATCVEIDGHGVLLRGAPGSGKSDLALRLIDGGGRLVADDQAEIEAEDGRLVARPPATIAGKIEVRGLGILRIAHSPAAVLRLVIDLVAAEAVERMPETATCVIADVELPCAALAPFEASAAAKVRLALRSATADLAAPS